MTNRNIGASAHRKTGGAFNYPITHGFDFAREGVEVTHLPNRLRVNLPCVDSYGTSEAENSLE